jgi:hypothetical protein
MLSPIASGPLVLISTLVLMLFAIPLHAIPYSAIAPYPKPYWQATAGLFYHRCSSPTQVEFSRNNKDWFPSALCKRGTCCSNLSRSPTCSAAACDLVAKELKESENYYAQHKAELTAAAKKEKEERKGTKYSWQN